MTAPTVGCPICRSPEHAEAQCPWFELSMFCTTCSHPPHAERCLVTVGTNYVPMGSGMVAFQSVPCGCDGRP